MCGINILGQTLRNEVESIAGMWFWRKERKRNMWKMNSENQPGREWNEGNWGMLGGIFLVEHQQTGVC